MDPDPRGGRGRKREISGRVIGIPVAIAALAIGWTSFVLPIALVGTAIAAISIYWGVRHDSERNER
jgi:hypothetical protein